MVWQRKAGDEMIGKDHAHLCRDIAGYVEVISQNPKLDSDGQTPSLGNDHQTSILRADTFLHKKCRKLLTYHKTCSIISI